MEKQDIIYIIGHKSPDTDTVCSAIAYAEYLKHIGVNAIPAICGEVNLETKYALEYFGIEKPINLNSIKDKKVVLVDYNEDSQGAPGADEAEIVEVIDHHKIGFSSHAPINFTIKPYGAAATIVAEKMFNDKSFIISKSIAGILICAILSDTVIFKSNTTTQTDIDTVKKLNEIARIEYIEKFGIELKKQKSSLQGLSTEDIICSDFKTFEVDNGKFGVGQIEVVDSSEAQAIKQSLIEKLNEITGKDNLLFTILMITNIIEEGSELLLSDNCNCIQKAFNKEVNDNSVYIDKMMSRKKDLVPFIIDVLE